MHLRAAAAKIGNHDERVKMPSAIQIISKLRLMKLKIPSIGVNPDNYDVTASGDNPKRPKSWAGNFAVVVPSIRGDGEQKALRFFLAKTPSHITQVTSFINKNPHSSLVKCKMFRNTLIMKNGEKIDMMEMDFVEGNTLDDFVIDLLSRGSASRLVDFAESIRSTVNELVTAGFYHGDLSHSNIMVADPIPGDSLQSRIRLIDYDAVLVKGVQAPPNTKEVGHPNYQHPSRKTSRFTLVEDVYFSALVVYVSLIAISVNPKLWESYHSKGDNLIFQNQRGDLRDITSPVWGDLEKIQSKFPGETGKALDCLKKAIKYPTLEGSNFLSEIEEWFSLGTHIDPSPIPVPEPGPVDPVPPHPGPKPSPSPQTRSIKTKPTPSPKPGLKNSPTPSPSPQKRKKPRSPKPTIELPPKDIPIPEAKKQEAKKPLKSQPGILKKLKEKILPSKVDISISVDDNGIMEKNPEVIRPNIKESITKPDTKPKKRKVTKKTKKGKTAPVPFSKLKDKKIVIDGTNILHEAGQKDKFYLQPLLALVEQLESGKVESINVVFDASTPYKFSNEEDKEKFNELVSNQKERYTLSPKSTEADAIILNIAYKNNALIISNDFYQDYEDSLPEEFQWFSKHHITSSQAMDIWTLNTTSNNEFLE